MIIDFQITSECNLDCKYCFDILKGTKESHLETVIKSLDILSNSGVTGIVITGGEPLLFKGLREICRKAKELGMYVYLSTNGKFLTDECEEVIKSLNCIGLPLDTIDGDTHAMLGRPINQLDITLDSIKRVKKLNKEAQIKIGTVVNSLNEKTIESVGKALNGVLSESDTWRLYEFNPIGNGGKNKQELSISYEDFMNIAKQQLNKYEFQVSPMSITDSEDAYIFVGPDMHLLSYGKTSFYDYGLVTELGEIKIKEIFEKEIPDIIEKSKTNRKWVNG